MVRVDKIRRQIASRRQEQGWTVSATVPLSTAEKTAIEDRRWRSEGQWALAVAEPTPERLFNSSG
jgi:hypothetical protein